MHLIINVSPEDFQAMGVIGRPDHLTPTQLAEFWIKGAIYACTVGQTSDLNPGDDAEAGRLLRLVIAHGQRMLHARD